MAKDSRHSSWRWKPWESLPSVEISFLGILYLRVSIKDFHNIIIQNHSSVMQNIPHIQHDCKEYSSEYCQSVLQNTAMGLNNAMSISIKLGWADCKSIVGWVFTGTLYFSAMNLNPWYIEDASYNIKISVYNVNIMLFFIKWCLIQLPNPGVTLEKKF